jgi:hypothetical protein
MLLGIHRRVLIDDLAGGRDHIRRTIRILGLGGEHGVVGFGDALTGIGPVHGLVNRAHDSLRCGYPLKY